MTVPLHAPSVPTAGESAPEAAVRFAELFRQNVTFIARSLRRLGVAAENVEDLVQEVFLVAASKLESIAPRMERAFLFGTAMRVASNARRTRGRAEARRERERGRAQDEAEPAIDELVDQHRARELLDAVLEKLPLELRAVFVLFELEGMTTAEIAALLDLPAGTVASRLRRAREHFDEEVALLRAKMGDLRHE